MDREPPRSPDLSTRDLVDRCYQHDARAWEEFVHRYHGALSGYVVKAYRRVGWRQPNERDMLCELVQDVYSRLLWDDCKVLRSWRGQTEESLRAYLATISNAVTLDRVRRDGAKKRTGTHVSIDATEPDGGRSLADEIPASDATLPDRLMDERIAPERLNALLVAALSGPNARRDGLIFQLHALDGMTASEIAAVQEFKMQVSTVESVIRRTRERLKKYLDDHENPSG